MSSRSTVGAGLAGGGHRRAPQRFRVSPSGEGDWPADPTTAGWLVQPAAAPAGRHEKTAPNTHRDIQFLLTAFNWNRLVQVEYVTNELLHLHEMQIICKKKKVHVTIIS
jgi:hypothetical protein